MPFLLSLLLGVIPMLFNAYLVYWVDRYEKEPLVLLGGVFTWGALLSAGLAYLINTLFGIGVYLATGSETMSELSTGVLFAPLVEETLKGAAVLVVFLVFRKEFDSLLDGVIYSAIVALGFAATENVLYIFERGYLESGYGGLAWLAFVRVVLVGWQHPFYTAFIGIGFALARTSPRSQVRLLAPLLGWLLAVANHALHNIIALLLPGAGWYLLGTAIDWTGWLFMLLFVIWAIRREQKALALWLEEELETGAITVGQYRSACSAWEQWMVKTNALFSGRYRQTNRFFQVCGELAHKKQQRKLVGEEGNNSQIIAALQQELKGLSLRLAF